MTERIDLPDPDSCIPGTVGPPGRRVFYLQARAGQQVLSLRLEKQQVLALATYLREILADLPAAQPDDDLPTSLAEPVVPAFTVGPIGVGYREDLDRIVLALQELDDSADPEENAPAGGAHATIQLTRAQAVHLVALADELMATGRAPCPLCAKPMDPDGHACTKSNGHGRHS